MCTRTRTSVSNDFIVSSIARVVSFAVPWSFHVFSLACSAFAPSSCFVMLLSSTAAVIFSIHLNSLRLKKKKDKESGQSAMQWVWMLVR